MAGDVPCIPSHHDLVSGIWNCHLDSANISSHTDARFTLFISLWGGGRSLEASIQGAYLQEGEEGLALSLSLSRVTLSCKGMVVVLMTLSFHLPHWPEPPNPIPIQNVPTDHSQSPSWSLTLVLFSTLSSPQSIPPDTPDQPRSHSIISPLASGSSPSSSSWHPLVVSQWDLCSLPPFPEHFDS